MQARPGAARLRPPRGEIDGGRERPIQMKAGRIGKRATILFRDHCPPVSQPAAGNLVEVISQPQYGIMRTIVGANFDIVEAVNVTLEARPERRKIAILCGYAHLLGERIRYPA